MKVNKRDLDLYQAGNKDTSVRVRDKQLVSWLYVTRWLTVNGRHKQTMSNILSLTLCGDLCDVRCPSSSVRPRVATYSPHLYMSDISFVRPRVATYPYLYVSDISSVGPRVLTYPSHLYISDISSVRPRVLTYSSHLYISDISSVGPRLAAYPPHLHISDISSVGPRVLTYPSHLHISARSGHV